ncbi:MAG: ABC transporter ATP-binding protein, partial [Okeania sp. SIO2H7]|nr:ABC transporter ATP-binding protein [Okeania sp. SIO2H7]
MIKANTIDKITTQVEPEKSEEKVETQNLYLRLFTYGLPHKTPFLLGILLTIIASFITFFVPQINRYVIDVIIPAKEFNMLPWVAALILLMSLVGGILSFLQLYAIKIFGENTIKSIRIKLYQHLQFLSISYFENQRTGELILRLGRDVEIVGQLLNSNLIAILIDSFAFIVVFIYLLISNWLLAIAIALTWPLIIYLLQFTQKRLKKIFQDTNRAREIISNH